MLQIPRNTILGKFMEAFASQMGNPSQIGLKFFRVPVEVADDILNRLVSIYEEGKGTPEDQQLTERYRLNDEGLYFRQAFRYKFQENELFDGLAALGIRPEDLRDRQELGNLMKGYLTDTPLPLRKQVNGKWVELGEACLQAVRGADGKVEMKVLPTLPTPQYEMAPFKNLFTPEQVEQLKTEGRLGQTMVMKDFATGRECECFVSFHKPTGYLTTLPVDEVKVPDKIYGKPLTPEQMEDLRAGKVIETGDIALRKGNIISGKVFMDANRRGPHFVMDEGPLRISNAIEGAQISDETRKLLEKHKMVFITGMKRQDGGTFSSDVVFDERGERYMGKDARRYNVARNSSRQPRQMQPKQHVKPVRAIPAPESTAKKSPAKKSPKKLSA